MKLLGTRNWYLPKGLHWLPKFEHEPAQPEGESRSHPAAAPAAASREIQASPLAASSRLFGTSSRPPARGVPLPHESGSPHAYSGRGVYLRLG